MVNDLFVVGATLRSDWRCEGRAQGWTSDGQATAAGSGNDGRALQCCNGRAKHDVSVCVCKSVR